MNYAEMTNEALEERLNAIVEDCEKEGADTDALLEETRAIKAEMENRKKTAEAKAEIRNAVAKGNGEVVETKKEERNMENIEVRNTPEYIDQYVDYIKTEKRGSLLTENVETGTVAVPSLVDDIVRHAWDKAGVMSRIKKAYLKGNLKVGFEISSNGATVHTEGGDAVAAENLVLGTVTLVPKSIKKWVSISDEVMDLRGEAFLTYIYEELTYQIAKKAEDEFLALIEAAGTVSTTTAVGVPVVTEASLALGTVAKALGQLSDEAANPVIIMNKATWANFKAIQYAGNFSADPFEGLDVLFNNTITAYDAATTGDTYAIVGDLGYGGLANFPNGQGITFKFDDTTDMTKDLVRVLGREYIGLGVVAPNAFVKIQK